MPTNLTPPYGEKLHDPLVDRRQAETLRRASRDWPSWSLTARQLCDLEMLLNGAFSPLDRFLGREDHDRVCSEMRLVDGTLWPLPVALDIPDELADTLASGDSLALRDPEGVMLAVLEVEQMWRPDRESEADLVYGHVDVRHPGVAQLLGETHPVYISGPLRGIQLPSHPDFRLLRNTPAQTRRRLARRGWRRVIGYHTAEPMHRPQVVATFRTARQHQASLFLQPAVGASWPGDIDPFTRVRCYQAVLPRYPKQTVELGLVPLAPRAAGPREALLQAIVRRNYGCSHFMVGRDQAGAGDREPGRPFYAPGEAQELGRRHEAELGIRMVPLKDLVYVPMAGDFEEADNVPTGARVERFSAGETRRRVREGRRPSQSFEIDEVTAELRRTYPPRHRQGFTVFFSGLSGAGKSTVANVLMVKLLEMGGRPVTLLDGDIVRRHLSSELTFSKEHRDINIRRIGYVASEITKNRGIAICAPIAPYDAVRKEVRQMVAEHGGFVLVHIATPLDVCESRDRKGMYAKARAGIIKEFTGISDPYEEPADAEISIDTSNSSPHESALQVLLYLENAGFIGAANEDNGHGVR